MDSREALKAEVVSPEEDEEMVSLFVGFCEQFGGFDSSDIDCKGSEWRSFLKWARKIDPTSKESDLLTPQWFQKCLPEGATLFRGGEEVISEDQGNSELYSTTRSTMIGIVERWLNDFGSLPSCLKNEPPPPMSPIKLLAELRGLKNVRDSEEIFKKLNLIRDHLLRMRLIDLESYFNLKEIIERERRLINLEKEMEE